MPRLILALLTAIVAAGLSLSIATAVTPSADYDVYLQAPAAAWMVEITYPDALSYAGTLTVNPVDGFYDGNVFYQPHTARILGMLNAGTLHGLVKLGSLHFTRGSPELPTARVIELRDGVGPVSGAVVLVVR